MMINKRFTSIFISLILMGSVLLLGTLPTFADSDTVVIGGIVCSPIELTNDMVMSMFQSGDASITYNLYADASCEVNVYDMTNQVRNRIQVGPTTTTYNLNQYMIGGSGATERLVVYTDQCVSLYDTSIPLKTYITMGMPFPYLMRTGDTTIKYRSWYTGSELEEGSSVNVSIRAWTYDDNNSSITTYTSNKINAILSTKWSSETALLYWYNLYNWVPGSGTLSTTKVNYINIIDSPNTTELSRFYMISVDLDSVRTDTTSNTAVFAPMAVSMDFNTTVYVPVEYETAVQEYLEIITGSPSASDQQRINELKSEMNSNAQALSDAADDLHKDLPDLPDVADLPEEVSDGMSEASETVITPLMGIGVVNILVIVAITFSAIKLILYGSGPY